MGEQESNVKDVDEVNDVDDDDVEESNTDFDATLATDNVGEVSVEINVEDLIAEFESDPSDSDRGNGHCARKRLEEILEEKRVHRDLMDMEDYEIE